MSFALQGLGAAVTRVEDHRFLTGCGRFVDDLRVSGMAFAHLVRSPHAHARIRRIDTAAALAAPGVIAVVTAQDLAKDGVQGLPCHAFPPRVTGPSYRPLHPLLASEKVRHVGDRLAMVVADTAAHARDAGELVEIEYEALDAVTLEDALAAEAPKVWDEAAGNVSFQLEHGDRQRVDAAFSAAAHVARIAIRYPRISANAIEPRTVLADPNAGLTLHTTAQSPHQVREAICALLGLPPQGLRVIAPDVGGAFGMKSQIYPEEALAVWMARRLGRPVKWTADRSESIASDTHGRHQITEAAMAFDGEGRILALRASVAIDLGAYLGNFAGVAPMNAATCYTNAYRLPIMHSVVRAMFTNTCPTGPYRGTGKPEASYIVERLMDKAARGMGIDRVELRRRNLVRPSDLPYAAQSGTYDSGDFGRLLDTTLRLADWNGFAARRADSESRGLRRGIGLAMHCQKAGKDGERMEIAVSPDGSVDVRVGTLSSGQGHETMYTQMVSGWLGIPMSRVRVLQGDTGLIPFGRGTYSQRSMAAGGSALKLAADVVLAAAKRAAATELEAAESDIEVDRGIFRIKGTDRVLTFEQVARQSPALDGAGEHPGPSTFPSGCMICEVEVDPETGAVRVVSLASVDDAGNIVNPLTFAGQLHGSSAQGLGEAIAEQVVYERESGQLLTGSLIDYCMPRADDMPPIVSDVQPSAATTNVLGVKGGSEAGNVGAPAAIINAIMDALTPLGVTDVPVPATAERIWRAIHAPHLGGNIA